MNKNTQPSIFPEIKVLRPIETIKRLGKALLGIHAVDVYMSEHYHGAAEMLDTGLYDEQLILDFES